jgi:two-component system OmpR family sensor kinase
VAIIGLAGGFAVRWSLRPLARVTSTALRVSELPLATGDGRVNERVAAANPHSEAGQVAVAVNHMLDRVENALTERQLSEDRLRRFAADASHELRTPLAVVRSHAELIEGESERLSPSGRQSLLRISAASVRMSRLVDDLLLLARLDAGRPLDRHPVDLSRLAIDAVTDARAAGPDHRWSLDLPATPVRCLGDEHRLQQVIANLLANARLHTPAGTSVRLTVRQPAWQASVIEVADNGPGISADLLPRVTERFARGDSARGRESGGTGLGLAIVSAVIAAHRGRVEILRGHPGTVVQITLPDPVWADEGAEELSSEPELEESGLWDDVSPSGATVDEA